MPPPGYGHDSPTRPAPSHAKVPADFTHTIRELLRAYVFEGDLTVDRIAVLCNMSKRSLQRRLMEHGTCYSEILNELKYQVASEMLRRGDASITEVSLALGYANGTHFSRAFRRFAGISPRDYRRQMMH